MILAFRCSERFVRSHTSIIPCALFVCTPPDLLVYSQGFLHVLRKYDTALAAGLAEAG